MTDSQDESFLRLALETARQSVSKGGFPAGAVLAKDGAVVSEGISIGHIMNDPSSHGEMAAIRDACRRLKTADLKGTVLYTSLEPCLMCFGASMWGGITKIVFACSRESVPADYYGGHYDITKINRELLCPIELLHMVALEKEALAVLRAWQQPST